MFVALIERGYIYTRKAQTKCRYGPSLKTRNTKKKTWVKLESIKARKHSKEPDSAPGWLHLSWGSLKFRLDSGSNRPILRISDVPSHFPSGTPPRNALRPGGQYECRTYPFRG